MSACHIKIIHKFFGYVRYIAIFFVYGSHSGNGFRGIDGPDRQPFRRFHTADGFRYQGHAQAGAGPLKARSCIIVAAEDIGHRTDILECHGYDGVKAPIIDERFSGQIRKADAAVRKRIEPGGYSDCRKRLLCSKDAV